MAKAIHAGGGVAGLADGGVFGALVGKFPVLNFVDRHAAHAHGAFFTQDGDAAFQVLGVGEHGDIERSHGAAPPADGGHARVFHLDVARQGAGVGHDAFDRADQPVEQVDVMAGLVHEGAAVKLPSAAPFGAVVIGLRARPEHIDGHAVDLPEALLLDCALEQLQRGVAPVLLDHKKAHASLVAGLDHGAALFPARGHGFFGDDVPPGCGHLNGLGGVQPAGGGEDDAVGGGVFEQAAQAVVAAGAGFFDSGRQGHGIDVANIHQFATAGVRLNGGKMVLRNASASHECEADGAAGDGRVAVHGVLTG